MSVCVHVCVCVRQKREDFRIIVFVVPNKRGLSITALDSSSLYSEMMSVHKYPTFDHFASLE